AVGEGGVLGSIPASGGDRAVERLEARLEGVREALVVAAGIGDGPAGEVAHQGRIAEERLVGPVAPADPQLVGPLARPAGRARGDLQPSHAPPFLLPAVTCETWRPPRAPPRNRRRTSPWSSVAMATGSVPPGPPWAIFWASLPVNVSTSPRGRCRTGCTVRRS